MDVWRKLREIATWPELKAFWVVVALLIGFFISDLGFGVVGISLFVHTMSLVVLGVITFFAVFHVTSVLIFALPVAFFSAI